MSLVGRFGRLGGYEVATEVGKGRVGKEDMKYLASEEGGYRLGRLAGHVFMQNKYTPSLDVNSQGRRTIIQANSNNCNPV